MPQETPPIWSQAALILAAHGSADHHGASAPTRAVLEEIRRRGLFRECAVAFHKEPPFLTDVLRLVGATDVFVVPHFIAEGWYTEHLIPNSLGLPDIAEGQSRLLVGVAGRRIHYCRPVGTHPAFPTLISRHIRAQAALHAMEPAQCSVLLVAHGSGRSDRAGASTEIVAEALRREGLFGEVIPGFLEQEPKAADWRQRVTKRDVLVLPLLIAQARHGRDDIAALFTPPAAKDHEIYSEEDRPHGGPYHWGDYRILTLPPLGTAPEAAPALADLILDQARDAL